MTTRVRLFRQACELIAADRRKAGRDPGYHDWLVQQLDACAAAIRDMYKRLNRILDAYT
jgi:hypothetical protein